MSWYLKRNEGHGDRYSIGMFCKKHNLGPRSRSVGLTLDYANDGLLFSRSEVASDAGLAVAERLSVRIERALRDAKRALTYGDLADLLDADRESVKTTCNRLIGSGQIVKAPGTGRETHVALPALVAA
jgi:hypothetical protein